MASVMAIRSEVFGSCVGEINVSVEKKNRCDRLCCGCKFLRIIFGGESALRMAVEVGDAEGTLGALGLIEELKSPCGYRGFLS